MQSFTKMLAKCGSAAFLLLACFAVVGAQNGQTKSPPKQISGGILNGRAISLPKPLYPASEMVEKATGKVSVQVLVDEAGNVVSARAMSGSENTALRSAAESAALLAKFNPTYLSGHPVKVSGVITYNFVYKEGDGLDDGMNAFMAATVIFLVKDLAAHPEKFAKAIEMDDFELRAILKEAASDPDFLGLEPLAKLEETPADKRVGLVESVLDSLAGKLTAEHAVWKFELGRGFSDVLTPVMLAAFDGEPDPSKLDESRIKKGLRVMKQMLANAPPDIPKDILTELIALAALADRDDLFTEERFPDFAAKVEAVFDAVSP